MSELSLRAVIVVSGMTASGKGTLIYMLKVALASHYMTDVQVLGSGALRKALGVIDRSRAALRQAVLRGWDGDHAMPFRLLLPQIKASTEILILDGARHPTQLALTLKSCPEVPIFHVDVTRDFDLRLRAVMERDEINYPSALALLQEEARSFPCVDYAELAPFAQRHCYNNGDIDALKQHAIAIENEVAKLLDSPDERIEYLVSQQKRLLALEARYGSPKPLHLQWCIDELQSDTGDAPFLVWNSMAASPAS